MSKVRFALKLLSLSVLCFFSMQLFAADYSVQRKNFLYAEEALKKGNLSVYYGLKENLTTYPLYPYLQYQEIMRLMKSGLPTDLVDKFLATYPDSVLANQLRINWLKNLAKQQQWALYRKYYKTSSDVALQCYAIWAEYKTTQKETVLNKATPLWVTPSSQPSECNALFAAWQKSKYFTTAQAWKRTELAIASNQKQLAHYLQRFLLPSQQKIVSVWLQVHDNPRLVTSSALFNQKDPIMQTIQVYGIKRLMQSNTDAALTAWQSIKDKYPFTDAQKADVAYAFAIDLATSFDDRAITWLNAVPAAKKDIPIYEWRVRYFLRKLEWAQVINTINQMPASLQKQSSWRYWKARAFLALKQNENAQAILKPLAKERSYYGMLASDLRNQPYSLNHRPYQVSAQTLTEVKSQAAIKRAVELYQLKRTGEARREWVSGSAKFSEAQLQAAAQYAIDLKWYDRAIFTALEADHQDDLDIRFPVAYVQVLKSAAQRHKIDPAWAFAIARQESAFIPDTQSSAGAVGLMQLLPSTAKIVAGSNKNAINTAYLSLPEKNIELGSAFLRDMSAQFNYNRQLASAAYNAGASRVYRWMPDEHLPTDVWIETIPFKETRGYVQNVNAFWVIYNEQLNIAGKRLNHHASTIGP